MQNAILGMRYPQVSQSNNAWIPHKNYYSKDDSHMGFNAIDFKGMDTGADAWRAKMRLKCTAVYPYRQKGDFFNTVLFSPCDKNGNLCKVMTPKHGAQYITLKMTHDTKVRVKVGGIYDGDTIIYMEGTTGGVANHIHLEVCIGNTTTITKVTGSKYYNGVQYILKDGLPPNELLFCLKGYTEYLPTDSNKYEWAWCDSIEYNGAIPTESLKNRYQKINWNGLDVHVYKGFETDDYKLDLGLASAKGEDAVTALQTIDKIDYDVSIFAKMPCNYFQMKTGQSDPYGTHYGVEQGFTNDFAPKQRGYVVVCVNKDDTIELFDASNYWKSAKEVKCAFTPFWVGLFNGADADYYTTNFGDKRSLQNTQSALMRLKDGNWVFAVFNTKCTCWDVRKFAKEYDAEFLCCLDSGGSSQLVTEGTKRVYTGRAVPNALVLYKVPKNKPVEPEVPQEPQKPQEDNSELNSLRQENAELKTRNTELISANSKLEEDVKVLRANVNELVQQKDGLKELNTALVEVNNGFAEKFNKLNQKIIELQNKL